MSIGSCVGRSRRYGPSSAITVTLLAIEVAAAAAAAVVAVVVVVVVVTEISQAYCA